MLMLGASLRLALLSVLSVAVVSAAEGSLWKVTLDYEPLNGTIVGRYEIKEGETLNLPRLFRITLDVWRTDAGTPPWVFRLKTPDGVILEKTISLANPSISFDRRSFDGPFAGEWMAQIDNGPQRTWRIVEPVLLRPTISAGGVVSAAGYRPILARGSVASIFGTELAEGTYTASSVPLPRILGGVRVQVNGLDAPLWFVSPGQINFQVPYEAPREGPSAVVVRGANVTTKESVVTMVPYAPGVFTYITPDGEIAPVVTHADGMLVTAQRPAVAGSTLVVWGTGIGGFDRANLKSGEATPSTELFSAAVKPVIKLSGLPISVNFAGLTPGAVGLAQFNIQLPDTLPSSGSTAMLTIAFGDVESAAVAIPVQR